MGIIQLASMIFLPDQGSYYIYTVAPSLVYIAAAAIFWSVAPWLSRLLAKRNDGEFTLSGVTERQLYSTAFLVLGLYFTLSSFANVFSWFHFFAINKSPDYGFHHEEAPSYYRLTEGLMTLIAGIVVMLTGRTWAAKLARHMKSEQVAHGKPPEAPQSPH